MNDTSLRIALKRTTRHCRTCGSTVPAGTKFCTTCGNPLSMLATVLLP